MLLNFLEIVLKKIISNMSKGIFEANKELRKWWSISLGVGFILLFLPSQYPNISPIWILGFSLGPLIFYISYGNRLSQKHKDDVGFSDSVYYLGFTLTLLSLFWAIIGNRISVESSPDMTLTYFGYALSTTILGIAFRTYNNQFLYDDSSLPKGEAERISREIDDFSNSMEDLRSGLSNLTNSVNNDIPGAFNSSISQLKTGISSLSDTLNSEMPKINQEITDVYKELTNNIRELASSTSDSKNLFNNSMSDVSKPLNEAIQKISNDLNNQDVTIDKSIFYELEQNIKNVNEEFANSVKNLSEHLNDQKIDASLFNKLSRNMSTLNSKFEDMNSKFESLTVSYASALQQMNENNLKALEEAKKLNKELDKVKNSSNTGGFGRGFFGR